MAWLVVQDVKHKCTEQGPHRVLPQNVALPDHLSHLQGCLYFFVVAKVPSSTFIHSGFCAEMTKYKDQKAVLQDCMRVHSSMWSAASVSSGLLFLPPPLRTVVLDLPAPAQRL
jgi:hypothetical protein